MRTQQNFPRLRVLKAGRPGQTPDLFLARDHHLPPGKGPAPACPVPGKGTGKIQLNSGFRVLYRQRKLMILPGARQARADNLQFLPGYTQLPGAEPGVKLSATVQAGPGIKGFNPEQILQIGRAHAELQSRPPRLPTRRSSDLPAKSSSTVVSGCSIANAS